jgi:hypothetical protein
VAADGEPPAKRVCILLLTWWYTVWYLCPQAKPTSMASYKPAVMKNGQ